MTNMVVSQFDPVVNAVLERLLDDARSVLGAQFVGMYVHGSLAYDDYDAARSDMDILVVTHSELPTEVVAALQVMHERLSISGLARASNMEVSYIPLAALRRYDPANCHHPALRADGTFGLDGHGSEWVIQRYTIREKGVGLAGPDPLSLIDPITADDLRRAVSDLLTEWWLPQLSDPFRLHSDEYQAYAILTMCRMLYTLEHGTIVSKPIAAHWALTALAPRWSDLIVQGSTWRHGDVVDGYDDTLEMIRYTLDFATKKNERGQP